MKMLKEMGMTVDMVFPYVTSEDWKKRFIGEYWMLRFRTEGLNDMLLKLTCDKLDFKPNCESNIFSAQVSTMERYLEILEKRAVIEDIDLMSFIKEGFYITPSESAFISVPRKNVHITTEGLPDSNE